MNPQPPASIASRPPASDRRPPTSGALISVVLILLWGYAVYRLGTLWHSNKDYSFGWFVPLLALALFWERWSNRPARDVSRPAEGTFLLLAACALVAAMGAVFLEVIPNWRFAGWIFALPIVTFTIVGLYFLGGRSWSRHFVFPIFFILVAVPWPNRFEQPLIEFLSQVNAGASVGVANLFGVVAMQHGTLIETGGGFVGVDEACSGIRSFQSSVMVALFLGELFRYSPARRLLLLISAVVFAFACNVVRTTYLVCTCDLKGLTAVNLRHDEAGFAILGVTLVGLLAMTVLLRPRKRRKRSDTTFPEKQRSSSKPLASEFRLPPPDLRPPSSGLAFAVPAMVGMLLWFMVVEASIEFWFRPAEKHATSQAEWTLRLPSQNSEFSEIKISETVRTMLDYNEGKQAQWRDTGGQLWQLYYFRWLGAPNRYRAAATASQAYGHSVDVCLRNAGMILETNYGAKIIDLNGFRVRVEIEKFLAEGRCFHVATCNWEPSMGGIEDKPSGQPSTSMGIRLAAHALEIRDRGRYEKRVLKVGVWDMEKDEDAQAAIHQFLLSAVVGVNAAKLKG